ncbi:MAG: hypothetical protein JNG89_20850 [Planctomycetaceae bacterium]|nr:hypothetical protein [Planctomycetaceae bacterium]
MSRISIPRPGLSALIAVLAAAAVLGTIDAAGSYPELGEGPGITLDEVFNVEMGVYQWHLLQEHGWRLWSPPVRDDVFADGPGKPYNPDHPPLGRLWLGMWHDVARWLWPPLETGAQTVTACARVGSAMAFGVTVWLVGVFAGKWFGKTAGWSAALCYALMPRVFGHAHLAALETCMNLAFLGPILFVGQKWGARNAADGRPLRPRREWLCAAIAGVLIGLAFLTKIQAVLLPIPIAVWTLVLWRGRGLAWLSVAGLVTAAVFIAGWPWLQIDPVEHVSEYLGRGVERQTLNCWYFGHKYADVDVPWHYPFVLLAITLPIGTLVLGIVGVLAGASRRRRQGNSVDPSPRRSPPIVDSPQSAAIFGGEGERERDACTWLLLGTIVFVLTFFAMPGITVYDGTRLFLVMMPLWAMLCGSGAQWLADKLSLRFSPRIAVVSLLMLLALQSVGIVRMHPCELSYYNLAVGGMAGAERLGMERSYWQDSITRSFLREVVRQVPEGATLYLAPRLHPIQEIDLLLQSPVLVAHGVQTRAYDDPLRDRMRYVLVFRRRADQWASLEPAPVGGKLLAEVTRSGVQLAALYELSPP